MPRSILIDYEKKRGEILFGSKLMPVNLCALSNATGIPASTLHDYKQRPDCIPCGRLAKIIHARKLSGDEIIKLFKG